MASGDGFSDALLAVQGNATRSAIKGLQLHTGNPGVGGAANKSSAPMQTPVWTVVDAAGGFDLAAPVQFSGGTPNGLAPYVSAWSDTSGSGTWYGNFPLTGDLTFDSNGQLTLETFTVTGAAA
ncbi:MULTISPECIES: hypothetical protein [Mycobacterium avium complex (MAC)]|uniref:Uncharacterized protein n=2 Tax=Mycobacterium avium complex (MAC) TaxID=120793 RepID=A0ABX3TSS6_9MYCO|nr:MULTISPECIES: hypothetical protein [Mycobacterium avium complex (MAC)]ETB34456.1 hypothetical protein N602_28570 [Mycobacterium avium subsp. hominissuis 10-5606]MBZ4500192.1 hypothetical protein [Mycobacterium avium subsp. hominissuis]MBZ4547743.1 hypothetical protein [Mycobacterium avium subsp. hominissuis]MBZ4600372.1 hypothetical protein [Mycobacterium avium subsp. hominissuis]MDO2381979.1 hypothetical protein [Mycobacterium avium subsp. hominissuis]